MEETVVKKTIIGSTTRINELILSMEKRAWTDRSSEWFTKSMFRDIGKEFESEPVIIRRALAIKEMLSAMTNEKLFNSKNPHYIIRDKELIVGVITLGSLGLGKSFPNYITDDEKGVSTVSAKTEMGLFGHDSVNYDVMLAKGLNSIITDCEKELKIAELKIGHFDFLFEFCENLENNSGSLQEIFNDPAKSGDKSIRKSLDVISENDGYKGFRFKTYRKELKGLFDLLDLHLNKKHKSNFAENLEDKKESFMPVVVQIKKMLKEKRNIIHSRRDFYNSVKITCTSVIEYAARFSELAEKMMKDEKDSKRKLELKEISRICKIVPANPAKNFHEAL